MKSDFESNMEEKLEEIAINQDFFRDIKLEESEITEARINLMDHSILIHYSPEFVGNIWDKKTEHYLKKKNLPKKKVLERLVETIFLHELGHRGLLSLDYNGCPRDVKTLSEKFLDVVSNITGEKNKKKLNYFSNAITDIINNTSLKKINNNEGVDTLTPLILYFKEQALLSGGKFSKFYEAFVRLNLYFLGDKQDMNLLREYFTFDDEINQAIKNFLDKLGISKMKEEIYQGSEKIMVKNKSKMREYLMNPDNWENITKVFTEEFWKFMEQEPPQENLFGAGGEGFGKEGDSEGGTSYYKGDDEESEDFSEGDGFGDELNDDKTKKDLIKITNKGAKGPGWMTDFEYLSLLYEKLAEDKIFEIVHSSFKKKTYDLIQFGEKIFDPYDDSPRDITGVDFDEKTKNLELIAWKYKLPLVIDVKKERTNKPAVLFALFDTSGSMREPISEDTSLGDVVNPQAPEEQQWQWNSKYHISLINYVMIQKRMEELGVRDQNAFFVNFSKYTILSKGLKDSLKEALHPQFGGTKINLDVIKEITNLDGALIITLSDGEIDNWTEVFELMKKVSEKNLYIHIQMGPHSDYSKKLLETDISENNIIVKQVTKEEDLYNFVIDVIDYYYTKNNNETIKA